MTVLYADEFVKKFHSLPIEIQRLYRKQEERFKKNWRDARLQTKKLTGHTFPYSFRITRRYRVLFLFTGEDTAVFATIGHRKGVYT